MGSMKIVDRGVVFAGEAETDQQSCTFPGICVLADGRWLCTFRAAPLKTELAGQRVLLTWSDNEGGEWTNPHDPFVPPRVEGKVGTLRTGYLTQLDGKSILSVLSWVDQSNPDLPFFNEETEGLLDTRICLSRSEDRGQSWSDPEFLETPPFKCPTPITGPILSLRDGVLACQFELNKGYGDPAPWLHKSILQCSQDGGRSWPEHVVVSDDPSGRLFYWDQRPGVLSDGRILDLFWTFDRESETYRKIHARESSNNGMTWSHIWDTGIPGQPASPLQLRDGRIAMVYVDRDGPPAIKVRLSEDRGHTWDDRTETVLWQSEIPLARTDRTNMNEAWSEMSKFSVGLPATAPLSNGDILVVFYAGDKTDFTSILWVRIDPTP